MKEQKMCTMCYEIKETSQYRKYKHKVNKKEYIHIDSYCIDCRKLYDKEQHRIQRERRKELRTCLIRN